MKKSKKAAATMIRAGCLLLDQAYRDNEKRTSAKIPLPISNRSVGSVGVPDIFSLPSSSILISMSAITRVGRPTSQPISPIFLGGASSGGLGSWLGPRRSEEHTSELQSRGHLVCR